MLKQRLETCDFGLVSNEITYIFYNRKTLLSNSPKAPIENSCPTQQSRSAALTPTRYRTPHAKLHFRK